MALGIQKKNQQAFFKMKIFFATSIEDNKGDTLTRMGAKNRLLSYILFKNKLGIHSNVEKTNSWIRTYVSVGQLPMKSKKQKKYEEDK